jgi:hypothetical protein
MGRLIRLTKSLTTYGFTNYGCIVWLVTGWEYTGVCLDLEGDLLAGMLKS